MRRKLAVTGAVAVALLAMAGAVFWYIISLPFYEPGMVRAAENLSAPLDPPPQGADASIWNVEPGIGLYHFEAGSGRNVLIVHGGPGKPYRQPWPGLDALTDRYRFVYYDQRGSGNSTRPFDKFQTGNFYQNMKTLERKLGIGAQLADIERVRRILGDDKLIIIGHSFGAFLAALYAAEFPDHVKALILVAPADVLAMPQEGRGFFGMIEDRLPATMKGEFAAYLKRYLDYGTIFSKTESELAALNAEFDKFYLAAAGIDASSLAGDGALNGGWMVHAMYMSMGQRHDYRPALKRIAAPVVVIHAANDLQPETIARQYADAIPSASFHVIANAAHAPFMDQPQAFAALVGQFLDRVKQ